MSYGFAAKRVAIIGLGLIGGSLARALRTHAQIDHIVGCVESETDAVLARELGVVDTVVTDVVQAARGADVVVLAVPVGAMGRVCRQLSGVVGADTVITDVGSTKRSVIAMAQAQLGGAIGRFVPGHPIAGTEHSGLRAGIDELFAGRRTILTPTPETEPDALALIERLWQAVGASVSEMDAAHHDEVLAATSHLPHLLAFALVDTLARMAEHTEIFEYAAGGFTDFTRIASSDPALWTDIVFANNAAIMPVLDRYIGDLEALRGALREQDEATVTACFTRAKAARDRFNRERTPTGRH